VPERVERPPFLYEGTIYLHLLLLTASSRANRITPRHSDRRPLQAFATMTTMMTMTMMTMNVRDATRRKKVARPRLQLYPYPRLPRNWSSKARL